MSLEWARQKVLTANRKCERAWVAACKAAGTEREDETFDRYHDAKAELHEALDRLTEEAERTPIRERTA